MVGCIRKEGGTGFAEERSPAAVLLGEDDLIEEQDRGVVGRFTFAFMDELIEACKIISSCRYRKRLSVEYRP